MIWNCEAAARRMAKNDMASSLMVECVPDLTERLRRIRPNKQAVGSHRDFDDRFRDWARNGLAVFLQALEISFNGVTYIYHRLVPSFPLRNAPRQRRTLSDEDAILVGFNCDSKFHSAILSMVTGFAI